MVMGVSSVKSIGALDEASSSVRVATTSTQCVRSNPRLDRMFNAMHACVGAGEELRGGHGTESKVLRGHCAHARVRSASSQVEGQRAQPGGEGEETRVQSANQDQYECDRPNPVFES